MENCNLVFDVNGYLPNGFRVFVKNIPLTGIETAVADMIAATNKLIADGLTLDDPAFGKLNSGEKREKINGILRRKDQKNSDGTFSPTFDLYPDNPALGRRCVIINLDTPEETAEFERVTGYKVTDFKVYVAQQLNRKDEPNEYAEYAKPVHGNVSVVFKDNPAYDPTAEKKKRQHVFVRWEVANAPTPPAAAAPSGSAAATGDDWETEERRKAANALDNELITIFKVRYEPAHNGMGVERWIATARVLGGGTVPVVVYGEDVRKVEKEGYAWPKTDGDDLKIPVITAMKGSDRRITYVEPANANVAGNNVIPDTVPAWTYDRNKLLLQLSKVAPAIPYQERGATVDKMFAAGDFDKVSNIDSAVTMVVNRLATHKRAVNQ